MRILRTLLGASAWLCLAGVLGAQPSLGPNVLPNQTPSQHRVSGCKAGTDFQALQYRITGITVDDPFAYLYSIAGKKSAVAAVLTTKLKDRLFTYQSVEHDALALVAQNRFAPDTDTGFSVSVEFVSVQNCDDTAKTLELVYRIYSTDAPKVAGGAAESQHTVQTAPGAAAGMTQSGTPLHLTPLGGYNSASRGFAGARIQAINPNRSGFHIFDTFTAEGLASTSMHALTLAASGSVNMHAWVQQGSWRIDYANQAAPAGPIRLAKAGLTLQGGAQTRPFWNGNVAARFGLAVQGGILQANAPASLVPAATVPSAGYGSLKTYAGITSRTTYNVLSVSYGLELGDVRPATHVDWRKHIGDVDDEFWLPLADHKALEVETRFTAGGIQTRRVIPLAARFFGGSGDEYFIPGDAWQIRDVPVIRAIPADRFYLTGAGADRFAALNLTVAYPVKSSPIMPRELTADADFQSILHGQIVSATSVEQNYWAWKDPHFATAMDQLPALGTGLTALQSALNAAQTAHPGELDDQIADCSVAIGTAQFDVTNTTQAKGLAQYGSLAALLPADTDDLKAVHDACVGEVNAQWNDAAIAKSAADIETIHVNMTADFNAIDQKLAAKKATNDLAFVNRTLHTLFNDMNIFSISPVFVFDVARISPAVAGIGGTRAGPGLGIRLELASYVNFTFGGAWNVGRQPGEGRGALFFSIGIRDLFH